MPIPHYKVLIVDDEKSIRITMRAFLNDAGYEVDTAEDVHTAIQLLKHGEYDIVVSDIIMPQDSGVTLLRHIRKTAPAVQVIMMTGEPDVNTASETIRLAASDYLSKPVTKNALLRSP